MDEPYLPYGQIQVCNMDQIIYNTDSFIHITDVFLSILRSQKMLWSESVRKKEYKLLHFWHFEEAWEEGALEKMLNPVANMRRGEDGVLRYLCGARRMTAQPGMAPLASH